jgi:hypothetical protein
VIRFENYTGTFVNDEHECSCHQCSGDTPQCKFHYENYETYRGVTFGNEYKDPSKIKELN